VSAQGWIVAVIGVGTLAWLVRRFVVRRGAGTCCGEKECPAARRMLDRLGPGPEA